jgi:hypothetical protein
MAPRNYLYHVNQIEGYGRESNARDIILAIYDNPLRYMPKKPPWETLGAFFMIEDD